jgi:hypothetical protein
MSLGHQGQAEASVKNSVLEAVLSWPEVAVLLWLVFTVFFFHHSFDYVILSVLSSVLTIAAIRSFLSMLC